MERKRFADLIASIYGGRYHEQRSRLIKSGCTRLLYLVGKEPISEILVSPPSLHVVDIFDWVLIFIEGKKAIKGPPVPQQAIDTALASLNVITPTPRVIMNVKFYSLFMGSWCIVLLMLMIPLVFSP